MFSCIVLWNTWQYQLKDISLSLWPPFFFSAGYLGLYIVYVLAVVVSAYIYSRQKHQLNGSLENSGRGQGKVPTYKNKPLLKSNYKYWMGMTKWLFIVKDELAALECYGSKTLVYSSMFILRMVQTVRKTATLFLLWSFLFVISEFALKDSNIKCRFCGLHFYLWDHLGVHF